MPLLHRAIDLHTGVTEMHRDEKREGPGCKSYFRGPVDPQGGETEVRGRPEDLPPIDLVAARLEYCLRLRLVGACQVFASMRPGVIAA